MSGYLSKRIDGRTLKIFAACTMLIDHIAVIFLYRAFCMDTSPLFSAADAGSVLILYRILRVIGRNAFPVFAFLLTEGFLHTSNKNRYLLRLFIFALISQIPYYPAFNYPGMGAARLNVMFTLLIGCLAMLLIEKTGQASFLTFVIFGASALLAHFIDCDYGAIGIAVIFIFYILRNNRKAACIIALLILVMFDAKELASVIAMLLIYNYNGERGRQHKYFFYAFYPAHILLLYLLFIITAI